jgi:hypothetical protein
MPQPPMPVGGPRCRLRAMPLLRSGSPRAVSTRFTYGVPANAAASDLGHDPATYNGVYVRGDQGHDLVAAALSRMQSGVAG